MKKEDGSLYAYSVSGGVGGSSKIGQVEPTFYQDLLSLVGL